MHSNLKYFQGTESEAKMKPLLTTEEIAEYLRVEVVTVRRLVTRGELPAYRIGGEFRFMDEDVERFVKSQLVTRSGSELFEKFTERMHLVFSLANQEADEAGHNYIGTEHLLLGILREGEGLAARALQHVGLDFQQVRTQTLQIAKQANVTGPYAKERLKEVVMDALKKGYIAHPTGDRVLTMRVKKVIELAVEEARGLKHDYVGTEHLLLGILHEGEGLAAKVLIGEYGLQLEPMRQLVLQLLQGSVATTGIVSIPTIPEEAATLLVEDATGTICSRCQAKSPAYFRHCFHCGLKLA
jgi:excisionase family DNA binding protein